MADTKTLGFKVSEDFHKIATEFQKEVQDKLHLTGEGFLEELIRTYKIESTKEQIPQVAEDLKELQALTRRIDNIYLNLACRIDNIEKAKDDTIQEVVNKKDSIIFDMQNKYDSLNSDYEGFKEVYNTTINLNTELREQVNQLTSMYNDKKDLTEEFKNKNIELMSKLDNYKQLQEQVEKYKAESDKNTEILSNQDKLLKEKNTKINNLENKYNQNIEELNSKHIKEKDDIKIKFEFQRDKSLFEQDKLYQSEIRKINDENNSKVKELLNVNQRYNEKIINLLEENQTKGKEIDKLMTEIKKLKEENEQTKR